MVTIQPQDSENTQGPYNLFLPFGYRPSQCCTGDHCTPGGTDRYSAFFD